MARQQNVLSVSVSLSQSLKNLCKIYGFSEISADFFVSLHRFEGISINYGMIAEKKVHLINKNFEFKDIFYQSLRICLKHLQKISKPLKNLCKT